MDEESDDMESDAELDIEVLVSIASEVVVDSETSIMGDEVSGSENTN